MNSLLTYYNKYVPIFPNTNKTSEAVATLIRRIETTSREDRKRAVGELKKICQAPGPTQEIGKAGMDVLLGVLKSDKQDHPLITEILEIFRYIMKPPANSTDTTPFNNNLEIFVQDKENLLLLLSLLEENDKVKFETAKLLTILLSKKPMEVQEVIIHATIIPTLVEMLKCSDIIRNEVLLLLKELAQKNPQAQTMMMFAGTCELLMEIMKELQYGNGGIVVQDCLHVLNNILWENPTNINCFRENGIIPKLAPLLELEQSDTFLLEEDKSDIILLALDTVSLLTTGNNPQDIYSCQTALNRCQALQLILKLSLGGIHSPSIRSKGLWTLGHLIRGHSENCARFQEKHFSSVTNQKQQHSVLRLLSITFTSKVYKERRASLHTLQCFLHGNEDAQLALASTVTPPPAETPPNEDDTVGRILLRYLTNWEKDEDNLRPWYACIMLSYILHENRACKELLLRIQLEIPKPGSGATSESLFSRTIRELIKAIKIKTDVQIQVGMLRLLSVWVYDCPPAVQVFLQSPSHTQFLVELIGQRSTNLHVAGLSALVIGMCLVNDNSDAGTGLSAMLSQKMGLDKFSECLSQINKSEDFVNAVQGKSHMNTEDMNKLMFYDHDYTLFFNTALQQVMSRITKKNSMPASSDQQLLYYQEIIANQDIKIKNYENKINQLQLEMASLSGGTNSEATQKFLQQIKDQNSLNLELQNKVSLLERGTLQTESLQGELAKLREEVEDLKAEKKNTKQNKSILKQKLTMSNQKNLVLEQRVLELEQMQKSNDITNNTNMSILHNRIEQLERENTEKYKKLETEQEELYVVLAEKTIEIRSLKKQLGIPDDEEESGGDDEDEDEGNGEK